MLVPCRIEMLGGLRAVVGGREITRFRTQKVAGLLAYLAYHLRQAHPREVVAEVLWPGRSPRQGKTSLNTAVSSLRRQLEPPGVPRGAVIKSDRTSLELNPEAVATDVAEFESSLRAAAQADSATQCREHLSDAIALYQGELLPGHYENWVIVEQRKLADAYFGAVLELTSVLEQSGEIDHALQVAGTAVTRDPLREDVQAELMRLLAALGQADAALRQYEELRELLAAELGRPPSARSQRLAEEISAQASQPLPSPERSGTTTTTPSRRQPERYGGTVTLLLTDIEGSTGLWERLGDAFRPVLEAHHELLHGEFARHGGVEVDGGGDSFIVSFAAATDALECAVACQQALAAHSWPEDVGQVRVRMALHTGDVKAEGADYHDVTLHRASRTLAAGHGGQILCSEATAALVRLDLPSGVDLVDLGAYRLRDGPTPHRLFQVNYPGMPAGAYPPLRAEAAHVSTLPLRLTRFFGRERELGQIAEMLTDGNRRLVTLTGAGGSGKTRLAVEVGDRLLEAFRGRVWFVPLADISSAGLIGGAIVDALALPRSPELEPLEQAVRGLERDPSLLVLDNLEQLGEEGALLVHNLLDRARTVTCLATSRQRLNVPGEQEFLVDPLPTPGGPGTPEQLSQYESVQLFVDRAQATKPDFQVTPGNADAIATLCARLDGLPLALELAAARAQVFTPAQMVAQLEQRFDFLATRERVTQERHRTLRAAIDWSCRLLAPELQRSFARLSVFRGGWTVEAAEAVCEEPRALEYLERLRDSSMVSVEDTPLGMRFRLLETLREYGRERLDDGEWQALCRRHAEYFTELAQEAEHSFLGPHEIEWMDRLEADHENLRAVLDWSNAQGMETELEVAGLLWDFWRARGHLTEGRRRLSAALQRHESAAPVLRATALLGGGVLAHLQDDRLEALQLLQEGLRLARLAGDDHAAALVLAWIGDACGEHDPERARQAHTEALSLARDTDSAQATAMALSGLGWVAAAEGDYESSMAMLEESLALHRSTGDRRGEAWVLGQMAVRLMAQGDYARAEPLTGQALAVARECKTPAIVACALDHRGLIRLRDGQYRAAEALLREALAIREALGAEAGVSNSMNYLSGVYLAEGRHEDASRLAREALQMASQAGFRGGVRWSLDNLARTALARGQPAVGARLLAAVEVAIEAQGRAPNAEEVAWRERHVASSRETLGKEGFDAIWAEARAMTLEEAVEYALNAHPS